MLFNQENMPNELISSTIEPQLNQPDETNAISDLADVNVDNTQNSLEQISKKEARLIQKAEKIYNNIDFTKDKTFTHFVYLSLGRLNASIFIKALFGLFGTKSKAMLSRSINVTTSTLKKWETNNNPVSEATLKRMSYPLKERIEYIKSIYAKNYNVKTENDIISETKNISHTLSIQEINKNQDEYLMGAIESNHNPDSLNKNDDKMQVNNVLNIVAVSNVQDNNCVALEVVNNGSSMIFDKALLPSNYDNLKVVTISENIDKLSSGDTAILRECNQFSGDGIYLFKVMNTYIARELRFSFENNQLMIFANGKFELLNFNMLNNLRGKIIAVFKRFS